MSFQRYMTLWWSDEDLSIQELTKLRRLFPDECYDWQWMFFHGMDPDKGYYPGIAHAYEKRRWQVLDGDEKRSWAIQARCMKALFDHHQKIICDMTMAEAENIYFDNHGKRTNVVVAPR